MANGEFHDTAELTINDSTISGNTGLSGGGLDANNGTVDLNESTLTNNTALNFGGGISCGGTVNLTDSTVSNNTALNGDGGGLGNRAAPPS